MSQDSTSHIIQSLVVNLIIAVSKGVAAAISGSGAMLAETLHSLADCGNQALLLLGVRRTRQAPDAKHPMGYGRELYFWSFMVALLLFTGGGVFSIYEGIHKTLHPEKVESISMGVIVLAIALVLEGWATVGNVRELHRRRGDVSFFRYLQRTKDSDLVVVFGENSAAVLGLVLAIAALALSSVTGDGRWDGIGSLAIGAVLIAVAVFLAIEVKSLLVGEAADPELEKTIRDLAMADPNVDGVLRVLTTQQGPGEVVVALKLKMKAGLTTGGSLCDAINNFERNLKAKAPEVKWSFIEPDMRD
jgi:cation diffusion facilitator family transporter